MSRRIRIETEKAPPSTGFRSQGMVAEGFLFTGGQIGAPILSQGEVRYPAESLEEQVILCLQYMEGISQEAGTGKDRVVEVSAFLTPGNSQEETFNLVEKYLSYVPPLFHPCTVANVAMHARLEMDWIALTDPSLSKEWAADVLRPFGGKPSLLRSGPFIFLNGLTAPGASLYEQTINLMAEADRQLREAGSALSHSVKLTVYIPEFDIYPQFNEATKLAFSTFVPPTRSVLVAPEITQESLLRIDMIALANGDGD